MDYERLCDEIFKIDDKIRFVAVYDDSITKLAGGIRKGLKQYLTDDLTLLSVEGSFLRWRSRKNLKEWIGEALYAFTEYEKVKRFTFYISPKKLLLVSTERDVDTNTIANAVRSKL